MTISLSQMIADLNAKIAAADSNTPIATVLQYVTEAERLGGGQIIYDSSGVLPSDSAYEGMIAYVADSATLKVRGDYGWAGIADSASVEPYSFQGSTSGYNQLASVIEKYSFTSDGNATDVGDLTVSRNMDPASHTGDTSGYTAGGNPTRSNIIDKFPFSTDANATDVGDLTQTVSMVSGQSSSVSGYSSGGNNPGNSGSNVIDKFPFSTDANATDVGNLLSGTQASSSQSSADNGYVTGGAPTPSGPTATNVIQKFPFATDANATDVGDMITPGRWGAGSSSTTYGYQGGLFAQTGSAKRSEISKFSFASDGNAASVGSLTTAILAAGGSSSTTYGYRHGGFGPSNTIDKYSYSSDGNATDVGDLTVAGAYHAEGGSQV